MQCDPSSGYMPCSSFQPQKHESDGSNKEALVLLLDAGLGAAAGKCFTTQPL